MRIVALIVAYYPQRHGNLATSATSIMSGSIVPDELIVLNNNPDYSLPLDIRRMQGIKVVSSWNSWTRGKYGAALMSPADYYLLLDDDITVKPKTLECLLRYAKDGCCIGGEGRILDEYDMYNSTSSKKIWPLNIQKEVVVDSIVGQLQFLSMTAILRMFALESEVRLDDQEFLYEAEDILVGLANHSTVVPMKEESESPLYMDECGVCLPQIVKGYSVMRERFTKKVLRVLEKKNYPWLSSAPWRIRRGL